jgi:hypothetical protein
MGLNILFFRFSLSLNMELLSFIPVSLDLTTSIIILILTLMGAYWFWLKPRLSSSTKSDDVIRTIKNLQA